jgi:hypothetical protein
MRKDIKCPSCNQPMGVADDLAGIISGDEVCCDNCGDDFKVISKNDTSIQLKVITVETTEYINEDDNG